MNVFKVFIKSLAAVHAQHKANYFKGAWVFTLFIFYLSIFLQFFTEQYNLLIFLESITAAAYASLNNTNRDKIPIFPAVC